MTPDEIRSAVRAFLTLVRDTRLGDDQVEAGLPLILDRLALASHYTPDLDYASYEGDGPEYDECRRLVAKRFPGLGLYPIVDAGAEPGTDELWTGDAIDDLADIYGELCAVEALWAAGESDRAVAALGAGFEIHWGRHLRELQLHLHARSIARRRQA